jgi:hypothetical protein
MNLPALNSINVSWGDGAFANFFGSAASASAADPADSVFRSMAGAPESIDDPLAVLGNISQPNVIPSQAGHKPWQDFLSIAQKTAAIPQAVASAVTPSSNPVRDPMTYVLLGIAAVFVIAGVWAHRKTVERAI